MIDILFVAMLTAWSAAVGTAILRVFDASPSSRSDRLSLAVTVGFGTMALGALALGEFGLLDRAGLVALLSLGAISSGFVHLCHRKANFDHEPSRFYPAIDLPLGITLIGTLLTALAPATDGDALCYHLQVPKIFLHSHGMTFDPDLHETVYPLVTEMLYAVALAFRGTVACRLIQWVLGVCFAGCVTALARPSLGDRARWAGTVALLVPAVSNGMGAPLNDVSLATFANAALVALLLWRDRPSPGRALFAGLIAGMAIGVKYPALVWVGVLVMYMIGILATQRISKRTLVLYVIGILATGSWWYVRAYFYTGNPVYPFFRGVFGGSGIDDVLDPIKRPMTVSLPNLITALGTMTLQPDRFDSLSHQFGPAFLLLVPGLFLLKPPKRVVLLASLGFIFLTLCLTQRQSMRFVLASVGPFAVAAAWVISSWKDRGTFPGRLLMIGFVGMLMFESAIAVGRARHGLSVVFGQESEDGYLDRREPTYRVGKWIDTNLAPSAHLIGQDHRGFYIPRSYTMELAHRRRTGMGSHLESPETILKHWREEGFTHVMLCPPESENAVEFDPTISIRLAPWLATQRPLYRESITDPDGVARAYAIYDLSEDSLADHDAKRRQR